jgi:hypothetical protein
VPYCWTGSNLANLAAIQLGGDYPFHFGDKHYELFSKQRKQLAL